MSVASVTSVPAWLLVVLVEAAVAAVAAKEIQTIPVRSASGEGTAMKPSPRIRLVVTRNGLLMIRLARNGTWLKHLGLTSFRALIGCRAVSLKTLP